VNVERGAHLTFEPVDHDVEFNPFSKRLLPREITAHPYQASASSWSPAPHTPSSHPPPLPTMASSQQPKGRDAVLTTLDISIQALNIAKDACGIPPAQVAFGSATVLLTMIRVPFLIFYEEKLLADVV
jgi:hypothetical protein